MPPGDLTLTHLLHAARDRQPGAEAALAELVYHELRGMAAQLLERERPDHTLQATALVHEAWMNLTGGEFESRRHFFGAASQAMRRLLIDAARREQAVKRGGRDARQRITFAELVADCTEPQLDLLALDEALDQLEAYDPRLAEVVRLRYFSGLSIAEVASLLEVSTATVKRDWNYARAWLYARMESDTDERPRDDHS